MKNRTMKIRAMQSKYKVQWIIWLILVVVVLIGTVLFKISVVVNTVHLKLSPQQTAEVQIFRLFPASLYMQLAFQRIPRERPELGKFSTRADSDAQSTQIFFDQPGAPVKLLVQSPEQQMVFEATPVSSHSQDTLRRDLLPYVDDGDPHAMTWRNRQNFALPSGRTTLKVTVIDVGEKIHGEEIVLEIEPPLSFKWVQENYDVLWWFMFWQFYAGILLLYGAVLYYFSKPFVKSTAE